ncbi:hypothetical protein [Terribacillus sp. 7520-G]|uniref:hypothetical protein n=1 Tax=Terribacillus TaxID=459532 RepID=UPI001E59B325|nr:hypothetical protein [Terribacillus sp. 7520-G]
MGILYLVFSWTIIPAIVGFVEGLIYFSRMKISMRNITDEGSAAAASSSRFFLFFMYVTKTIQMPKGERQNI